MLPYRNRFYVQLDPLAWPGAGMSPLNQIVLLLVLLSVLSAILQTEPTVERVSPIAFFILNAIFAILFSIEYGVRIWAMGESAEYAGLKGRLRYSYSPSSVLDLIATTALWVDVLFGVSETIGVLLRLARVLRAVTLTRNSRWSIAIRLLRDAVKSRSLELTLSMGLAYPVITHTHYM